MSHKSSGSSTPTKNHHQQQQQNSHPHHQQLSFHSNGTLMTSLGAMQPNTQMQNIAPAPAQHAGQLTQSQGMQQLAQQQQQQGQQQANAQLMGQGMAQPQFQVIQQPYGASPTGTPQFAMPQFATYNQQGQLVLQQGSFALPAGMQLAQQQGQQQFIVTNMAASPASAAPQKPGQSPQMIASGTAMPDSSTGKSMTPISQAYTIASDGLVGGTGAPQTFIMASPMGGLAQQPMTSMQSQIKHGDQKQGNGSAQQMQQQSPIFTQTNTTMSGSLSQTAQAPIIMQPSGMAYVPQQGQAYLQNGQIIFRAPAPTPDPNQQQSLMFSPTGQPLGQAPMQAMPQQLSSSIAQSMHQMSMPTVSTGMRSSTPASMQPPPGKTPISRSVPPILPNSSATTRPGFSGNMSSLPGLGPQQPSPKSKKVSPRGSLIGRPPGPKSVLNNLKSAPTGTMSPPRLPMSTSVAQPQLLGPPILQNSQNSLLPPPSQSTLYSQPPKLQPMMPAPMTQTSVANDTSKAVNSTQSTISSDKTEMSTKSHMENAPKAVVKPNVLTHVIDGHVIMESSEPFPVDKEDKGNLLRNRRKSEKQNSGSTKKSGDPYSSSLTNGAPEKKRGPGRPPGSTKINQEQQRIIQQQQQEVKSNGESSPSKKLKLDTDLEKKPASNQSSSPNNNPLKWSVTQVCDFIKNLQGCAEYVEDFQMQEIDGQALMLLKADHLMSAMQIKLGPALKICSAVNELREELKQN